MSRGQRIGALVVAALIAVAAFVVLRPDDERTEQAAGPGTNEAPRGDGRGDPAGDRPAAEPAPAPETITLRDGRPVGEPKEISVDSGEQLRLAVRSNRPAELHIHGYDRYIDVTPGRVARTRFRADLEGVFEIEEHGTAAQVAELRVNP